MFIAFVERDNEEIRHKLNFDKLAGQNALIKLRSRSIESATIELKKLLCGNVVTDEYGNVYSDSKYDFGDDKRRVKNATIFEVINIKKTNCKEWFDEQENLEKLRRKEIHEEHERWEYEELKKKYG